MWVSSSQFPCPLWGGWDRLTHHRLGDTLSWDVTPWGYGEGKQPGPFPPKLLLASMFWGFPYSEMFPEFGMSVKVLGTLWPTLYNLTQIQMNSVTIIHVIISIPGHSSSKPLFHGMTRANCWTTSFFALLPDVFRYTKSLSHTGKIHISFPRFHICACQKN